MLDVQIITDRQQWNEFLIHQPTGHLLQSYEWGELLQHQGLSIYRLGVVEDGHLIGTMLLSLEPISVPGLSQKLFPRWLSCQRGPAVEHPEAPALSALVKKAEAIAHQERAVALRLEPNVADADPGRDAWLAACGRLGFHTTSSALCPRWSWVLDLRPERDSRFTQFSTMWRSHLRLAERQGVVVRAAVDEADFDAAYQLLKSTGERAGRVVQSKAYHQDMLHLFAGKGNAVLLLTELAGELLSAKLLIRFGRWCWEMAGATTDSAPHLPHTQLLQYRCFQWAQEHGCAFFEFRAISEGLELGEDLWGVHHVQQTFGGCFRLHIPTQEAVYRPLIYSVWHTLAEGQRTRHRKRRAYQRPGKAS